MPETHRPPRRAPRRGEILIEALLAAVLLATGALAWLALAAALLRDERRADDRTRAAALLGARAARWAADPCAPGGGARRVGRLEERWTVAARDSLLVLVDSLHAPEDRLVGGATLVGVRACEP